MNQIIENFNTNHDTCTAYIKDGKLVCITETERISKHKHANYEFPSDECSPYIINHFNIDNPINVDVNNLKYNKHHELHALGSFLSSGYDESMILVIDALGDLNDSVTIFYGKNKDIVKLKTYDETYSLGGLYAAGSYLVYQTAHSEGKLMGLACCAEPEYSIPSPIQFDENGNVKILYIRKNDKNIIECIFDYIRDKFSYLFTEDGKILNNDIYKAKIAATVQYWFTEQVKNLVKYCKHIRPDINNLCLSGGCFLNCETNGEIDRMHLFEDIYCVPAPADNGLVLGMIQQLTDKPFVLNSPYLGINYNISSKQLKLKFAINGVGENESEIDNIKNVSRYSRELIVEKLKQHRILIWFDRGAEFGPRALGHRSFLADPTTNEMFWKLSVEIKQRESYRPLAPITTDNLYPLIFEDNHPKNLTQFMLKTVKIKDEWTEKLKAITHVNKTARPQRLEREINPELFDLIEEYYKQTGIPCLINTSLNLKNQPLLETYSDLLNLITNDKLVGKNISVVINHNLVFDVR